MSNIGGNITGEILVQGYSFKNEIGESEPIWETAFTTIGWLGLQTGESKRMNFNAKVEESSRVFLCDYHSGIYALADQDTRMRIKGNVYDVTLIDNPDEMDEQLEIYLRKVGVSNV